MNSLFKKVAEYISGASTGVNDILALCEPGELVDFLEAQQLCALFDHIISSSNSFEVWPESFRNRIRVTTRALVAKDLLFQEQLKQALEALAKAGIFPILMKGVPLAHLSYPSPETRPRCDTDLLICRKQIRNTIVNLSRIGFDLIDIPDLLTRQFSMQKKSRSGLVNVLDIHWRINNRPLLLGVLAHNEISKEKRPVPSLGANAFTLSKPHSLLLACIHRAAEGAIGSDERLLWLYDIHLLITSMDDHDLDRFCGLAVEKYVSLICKDALDASIKLFGTSIPRRNLDLLLLSRRTETSARLLQPDAPRFLLSDLVKVPGLENKLKGALEALFPPPGYMLSLPGARGVKSLPFLYGQRMLTGIMGPSTIIQKRK